MRWFPLEMLRWNKEFCCFWMSHVALYEPVLGFQHPNRSRTVNTSASVSHRRPTVTTGEQQRRLDLPSTDILLSDLTSELACSSGSLSVARGGCSVSQPERRTSLWQHIHPLSHNPPPIFISGEKKAPLICS